MSSPIERRPRLAVTAVALAATLGCGAAAEPRPAPRLVLLYAPCSLGTEFLSPYGAAGDPTPNLSALAADGVVFERHHTEAGQSGVAYAALFTGAQAVRHGVFHHPTLLADELTTLAETFATGGYEAWFWSGQGMGGARLNYGQGVPAERVFQRDKDDAAGLTANDRDFEALLDELARDPERRAYVQVNFTLTHHPYHKRVSPDELPRVLRGVAAALDGVSAEEATRLLELYDEQRLELQWNTPATVAALGLTPDELGALAAVLEALYARNVRELDEWLGRLLEQIDARGLAGETLIAFTADHGELLYRENALFQWTHGFQLAPEVIQVPLIVRGPGLAPGRYRGVTRSIDVHPTLAGLAGIDARADGTDLSAALRGAVAPPDQVAFFHTAVISAAQGGKPGEPGTLPRFHRSADPESMWVGARDGDLYFRLRSLDGEPWGVVLHDLARDPGLAHDRYDPQDPQHARMAERLAAYKAQLVASYESFAELPGRELPLREQLRRLRELGYVR